MRHSELDISLASCYYNPVYIFPPLFLFTKKKEKSSNVVSLGWNCFTLIILVETTLHWWYRLDLLCIDYFGCVLLWQPSWRRPKGIDSRVRRKFKGCALMPNIGYGSDKKTRHFLPNGFKKFVVHNVKELELLMMHNR